MYLDHISPTVHHMLSSLLATSQHFKSWFWQVQWKDYMFHLLLLGYIKLRTVPCNIHINLWLMLLASKLYEFLVHVKALECSSSGCSDYTNIPFGKITNFVFHKACHWGTVSLQKTIFSSNWMHYLEQAKSRCWNY
jgi:hypothetical protein